jgi:DNA repair protein RadD
MNLRDYQMEAVNKTIEALKDGHSPVVAAPTGSGKSLMIAALVKYLAQAGSGIKGLILTHRKELIEQTEKHFSHYDIKPSVYSAGLNRREAGGEVLIAGIQSVYRRPELWLNRRFVIIDEAHAVPLEEESMYGQLLSQIEAQKVGFTATPYRLNGGLIWGENQWFDTLAYQIEAKCLVELGYLSPLVGQIGAHEISVEGVRQRAGDFVSGDLNQAACDDGEVRKALQEALRELTGRSHVLVFAVSILHAQMILSTLLELGETVTWVHSRLPSEERDSAIAAFRGGAFRWCVNVGILTTGFDFPALDAIVALRPTASKSLHVQMLGRGMRCAPDKNNCLVLDFSGNCLRHGDIDLFDEIGKTAEKEEQEEKQRRAKTTTRQLPQHVLQSVNPMYGASSELNTVNVFDIVFKTTPARRYPGKNNVMVIYKTTVGQVRKWLCPEYETGARWYAKRFAIARGIHLDLTDAKQYMQVMRTAPRPKQLAVRRGTSGYLEAFIEYFGE